MYRLNICLVVIRPQHITWSGGSESITHLTLDTIDINQIQTKITFFAHFFFHSFMILELHETNLFSIFLFY